MAGEESSDVVDYSIIFVEEGDLTAFGQLVAAFISQYQSQSLPP